MTFSWLFSDEVPLPSGHRLTVLHHASGELGARRLEEAAAVLGEDAALEAARSCGRYELDITSARALALAGAETGDEGEVPALSPARWAEQPGAGRWDQLVPGLASGESVAGLLLTRAQRESFLRFLARNHVKAEEELSAEKAIRFARHFFFSEPLVVVLRYTPPRFASS